jgi:purine-binding chemotaxis protein CheW
MMATPASATSDQDMLKVVAFRLRDQEFCVTTAAIREIRGWAPSTPIPHTPPGVIGVMNLRGSIIPIVDLACKLGMRSSEPDARSAIVVSEVHGMIIGLLADRVSDILTVSRREIQPVPELASSYNNTFSEGIIMNGESMICLLDLTKMFHEKEVEELAA